MKDYLLRVAFIATFMMPITLLFIIYSAVNYHFIMSIIFGFLGITTTRMLPLLPRGR
jgi:hypothetical protein